MNLGTQVEVFVTFPPHPDSTTCLSPVPLVQVLSLCFVSRCYLRWPQNSPSTAVAWEGSCQPGGRDGTGGKPCPPPRWRHTWLSPFCQHLRQMTSEGCISYCFFIILLHFSDLFHAGSLSPCNNCPCPCNKPRFLFYLLLFLFVCFVRFVVFGLGIQVNVMCECFFPAVSLAFFIFLSFLLHTHTIEITE